MQDNDGYFVDHRVNPSMQDNDGHSVDHRVNPNMQDNDGYSVDHRVNPNMQDNDGYFVDHCVNPNDPNNPPTHNRGKHKGLPLHRMVQWFKTMTTNGYIRGVKNNDWKPFNKRLWQRNYYEHIIRNEYAYRNIAKYIAENPLRWEMKREQS